jgi:hypothetical protein
MKGWGRAPFLTVLGLVAASGCGGRTDSFDDYYDGDYGDEGGSSAAIAGGGAAATAGKPSKGGAAVGGSKPVGGKGNGTSGSSTGGVSVAGTPPVGGVGAGGASNSFGGSMVVGGFGGTFPLGGFGGFGAIGGTDLGGFGGEPQDCQSCLLQSCSSQFIECIQDFGCISIIACAQASGCQGIDCYRDKFCKGVIDQWGGPAGPSMNELLKTFACAANSGCGCN